MQMLTIVETSVTNNLCDRKKSNMEFVESGGMLFSPTLMRVYMWMYCVEKITIHNKEQFHMTINNSLLKIWWK